jgi:3-methyladenine DNA glycosylase Tag
MLRYLWQFVGGKPKKNKWKSLKAIPPKTAASEAMSKDLKKARLLLRRLDDLLRFHAGRRDGE